MTAISSEEDGMLQVNTPGGGMIQLDAFICGNKLSALIKGCEAEDTESQAAAMSEFLASKGLPNLSHRVQLRIYKRCLDIMEEAQKKDGLIQQQDAGAGSPDSTT